MSALHMPAIHIWVEIINPTTTIMLISYTSYTKKGELSATENMRTIQECRHLMKTSTTERRMDWDKVLHMQSHVCYK